MKTTTAAIGACAALALLATASAHADDRSEPAQEYPNGEIGFDRFEYLFPDRADDTLEWDFEAWYGGETHRVYLKSEGENEQGDGEDAEFEYLDLLYSRQITDSWKLQGGAGYQGGVGNGDHPERYYGVIALQGEAPFEIETELALRVSEDGDAWAYLEAEHDAHLTQRLILQPRTEIIAAGSDAEAFDVGQGLNSVSAGLRLRYEITDNFAPYVGTYWEKRYGNTADMARDADEPTEDTGLVAGIQLRF